MNICKYVYRKHDNFGTNDEIQDLKQKEMSTPTNTNINIGKVLGARFLLADKTKNNLYELTLCWSNTTFGQVNENWKLVWNTGEGCLLHKGKANPPMKMPIT